VTYRVSRDVNTLISEPSEGSVKKRISFIVLVFLVAYVGYAWFSVRALAIGVQKGDIDAIGDHVDFQSVRASLKEQITAALMAKAIHDSSNKNDAGAQIGAGLMATFGPAMIGNFIDGYATPSGIAAFMSTRSEAFEVRGDGFGPMKFFQHASIVSPTRFRLSYGGGTSVVFNFEDWIWKLTDIRVPQNLLDKARS